MNDFSDVIIALIFSAVAGLLIGLVIGVSIVVPARNISVLCDKDGYFQYDQLRYTCTKFIVPDHK